jgi:hypothetical protein
MKSPQTSGLRATGVASCTPAAKGRTLAGNSNGLPPPLTHDTPSDRYTRAQGLGVLHESSARSGSCILAA